RFRDSGTLHLLAVSGSNVALVIIFIILVLRPFSIKRNNRAIILIVSVFLFALLSYGEPSVVRASLMAVLVIFARIIERRFDLNQIIATSALIILLIDPAQLFSVSFQLSFVTAWGLIFIVPKVNDLFKPWQTRIWFRWLALPLIVSIVAQISSMPLIAYYFDRLPAISVAANLVIVPLVSGAVVASLFLFIVDLIWPLLGIFFGSLMDAFLKVVIYFLDLFGGENSAVIATGDLSGVAVILIYLSILLVTLAVINNTLRRMAIVALVVLINSVIAFSVVKAATEDNFSNHLSIFSIPGGTAILANENSSGNADLIITGLESKSYPIDERVFESSFMSLGIRKINRLFVLSSEFGAMDDILRVSDKYESKEIYIDQRLDKSFRDITNSLYGTGDIRIKLFSGILKRSDDPGIFPAQNALLIDYGDSEVLVLNDDIQIAKTLVPISKPRAVILYKPRLSEADLLSLQNFSHAICSNSIQKLSSIPSEDSGTKIHIIESQGPCRLILPGGESESIAIAPIR
ncbi:MAG: ComEC/Rec2 family competence protein, partial [Candidatus Zixiibacteriota bacterium]